MERRDAVASELLHERAVLRRMPPCCVFPVVVAQQAFVVAADPECAVFPDRDGVDVFAQRLLAEARHLRKVLFVGKAHRISAVGRTDPDVSFAVAEPATEIARIVEFVEPVYDVVVEDVVREVDRMEVVALCADVNGGVVRRSQHRDVEFGCMGQTPQQPGVGRGASCRGVEDHDALFRAEPDTALPVAASAAELCRAYEDHRVAEAQFPVVFEDVLTIGASAPEITLQVGFQHQGTVVRRILPGQYRAAGGVEEHHARRSRTDDLRTAAGDVVQSAFRQQALEVVVQRVVDADAACCGDPERAVVIGADVVDPVGRERCRIVRLALVVIIGLSVVAAKSVVGCDPDVADLVLRKIANRQVRQVLYSLRVCGDAPANAEKQRQQEQASAGRGRYLVG